jgi:hypothetical protein
MRLRASTLLLASACAGAVAASVAAAAPDSRPRPPALRGNQCLDPDFTRDFTSLDDHRLLVDNGRHRYLIEVSASCWNLQHTSFIGFRGDPVFNRVCGSRLDAILTSDRVPCRIERMTLLSREEYAQALAQHRADKLARRAQRKATRGQ